MATATKFKPTNEQLRAVSLAEAGSDTAISALAGAGKTSTLRLIAEALGTKRGAYVAFNRKIVDDGRASFPRNVTCSTAHSLAMKAVGYKFSGRLNSSRLTNRAMAEMLGLDNDTPTVFGQGDDTIEVPAVRIAAIAHQTVEGFCRTAAEGISSDHVPPQRGLDLPSDKTQSNNAELQRIVLPLARKIWADVTQIEGKFRFTHNHYLKMWQLGEPIIPADFVFFDEAQDANPLMMDIVERQNAQKIWVGDEHQMIYGWNGAVNAMKLAKVDARCTLTESFRFGPDIADTANILLERLDGPEIIGSGKPGTVAPIDAPDVYLGRTNGAVIGRAMDEMEAGRKVCIQGGTKEILSFAKAARRLMDGLPANHPELSCFASWSAVEEYVESDEGDDLRLFVGLIGDDPEAVINGLGRAVGASSADVTLSTVHKSKGAEWQKVALLDDFPFGPNVRDADIRLMYVAVTRAQTQLDRGTTDLEGLVGKGD